MPDSGGPPPAQLMKPNNGSPLKSEDWDAECWKKVDFMAGLSSHQDFWTTEQERLRTSRSTSRSPGTATESDGGIPRLSLNFGSLNLDTGSHRRSAISLDDPFLTEKPLDNRLSHTSSFGSGDAPSKIRKPIAHLHQKQWLPKDQRLPIQLKHSESEGDLVPYRGSSPEKRVNFDQGQASNPQPWLARYHNEPLSIPSTTKPKIAGSIPNTLQPTPETSRSPSSIFLSAPRSPTPDPVSLSSTASETLVQAAEDEPESPELLSSGLDLLDVDHIANDLDEGIPKDDVSDIWTRNLRFLAMTQPFLRDLARMADLGSAISNPLNSKEIGQGYIYMFEYPDTRFEGFVKIGFAKELKVRMADHESCYKNYNLLYPKDIIKGLHVLHAGRVEKLIHTELAPWNYHLLKCPGKRTKCNTHKEWFRVNPVMATAVIEKWSRFVTEVDPYEEVTVKSVSEMVSRRSETQSEGEDKTPKRNSRQGTPCERDGQSTPMTPKSKRNQKNRVVRLKPSFRFGTTVTTKIPAMLLTNNSYFSIESKETSKSDQLRSRIASAE